MIDDAPEAIEYLNELISELDEEVQVLATASSVVEGVKAIQKHQPDLIFLDIDLPDGSGFDVLEMTQNENYRVIFTTASDAHAIRAFKFSAIDYLLKPFTQEELIAAVDKAKIERTSSPYNMLQEGLKKSPEKIAITAQDKIELVNIDEIVRCSSQVNYTSIHLLNGQRFVVTKTLKDYDQLLGDLGFLRVHQSHLIQEKYIRTFMKHEDCVVLKNGDKIPVSTRKKSALLSVINQYKK